MTNDKIVNKIFDIAWSIEKAGFLSKAASLRRGAITFQMKDDCVMLERTVETAGNILKKIQSGQLKQGTAEAM